MGEIEAIYVRPVKSGETAPVERVRAHAGRGLEGDYHFESGAAGGEPGRDLTLIEAEAIEGLAEHGIELGLGGSRRNVVTRGIGLNDLVGERFRVGAVECVGVELCDPCRHLEKLTEKGVLKGLARRGGLRADILSDGEIAVGDRVG